MYSSPPIHTADIDRIRELTRSGRHPEALAAARDLSSREPDNPGALYLLAANQRCLNLSADALATLAQLQSIKPRLSRLYQERGFCYLALRDSEQAIAALQQAVTLNPALLASWTALQSLFRIVGDLASAAAAGLEVSRLKESPPEIVQAESLFSEGESAAAETLLRDYIKNGSRIETARAVLTRVLLGRQKYLEARGESGALLQLEPGNADYRLLYAIACAGIGDHESAIAAYREILDAAPALARVHLLLGHSLKAAGSQSAAIAAYQAAKDARPDFGDAYWSLANLKIYRFSDSEMTQMQGAVTASGTQHADRIHLHFALGQALEERSRYQESWSHYLQGNALKRAECGDRPELADNTRLIATYTRQYFAERAGVGAPDPDPIFIVGLPRSGSTLIEQILASHSLVEATQELNIVPRMIQELPSAPLDLTPESFRRLGERYLSEAGAFRKRPAEKPFVIDKLPANFRHLALIHVMLPNATIIDARREPMACCFSNFKQLYAFGGEFSYDLELAARYYRAYLELMQHWDEAMPGRIHRVVYEDLVEDAETTVRALLDFCGLRFEQSCLEFHKTERSIATPSSEQVRQPLNRKSLDRWTHYRPWLAALENSLGDARLLYNAPR